MVASWLVDKGFQPYCEGHTSAKWARRAFHRRQAAIDYLSSFPRESKRRWRSQGWLVMLRARHRKFLVQKAQGSSRNFSREKLKDPCSIRCVVIDAPLPAVGGDYSKGTLRVTELGQCEEGNSDQAFARTMTSVEEGILRDIVLYLWEDMMMVVLVSQPILMFYSTALPDVRTRFLYYLRVLSLIYLFLLLSRVRQFIRFFYVELSGVRQFVCSHALPEQRCDSDENSIQKSS